MPGEHLSLSKSSLAYAKLAATPTDSAWSQVYNAGNLFACLSLTLSAPDEEHASLQTTGKELFNNLEAEFFTLEEKNLKTISEAIEKSTKHIPEGITTNFCLAYFKDNTLYLFLLGRGRVIMKRGEKLGLLIERKEKSEQTLQTASGYLQNGDTVILETNQFAKNVSDKHIADALQLELPNDIAEALSVNMHEQADGDQAAIIITYHGIGKALTENRADALIDEDLEEQPRSEQILREKPTGPSAFSQFLGTVAQFRLPFSSNNRHINMRLNHRKRLFLSITVVILIILVASVVLTKQKQESTQNNQRFQAIYAPAFKNYDDGKSLKDLNETLSHEDFLKAEKLLKDNQNTFPKDSNEDKQLEDLLAKVEAELGPTTETTNASAVKERQVEDTDLLALEKTTPSSQGFSQDENTVYYVTATAVTAVTKTDGKKKEIIKNEDDWQKAVATFPYQGNVYLLDQKDGILKYVSSPSGFSKSAYLKDTVDLTKGVSIAIDSSVWVLFADGTIQKFTKGTKEAFTIKGLEKKFKNPTKIYTDKDLTNLYILDNGNSRIVKLSNDGAFQTEYSASVIQKAKDFEVLEKDKKILILSGDKIWELPL